MDKISKSLEKGKYVVCVILDFSKAFDTVYHDILLQKLHHYGVRGLALKWFQRYSLMTDINMWLTMEQKPPNKIPNAVYPMAPFSDHSSFYLYQWPS